MKKTMFHFSRVVVMIGMLAMIEEVEAQLSASQKLDIGFTALQLELGVGMPTGSGISVSQVEALNQLGRYRPNTSDFLLLGKNYVYGSGGATGVSDHATGVGRYFYGATSLAPGIGVSPERVTTYEVNGFLQLDYLQVGSNSLLPLNEVNDIQNHSWAASYVQEAANVQAIRRMDYAIQRDGFIATFGLTNNSSDTVPSLFGSSYNGIVVGRSDGLHSRGGTLVEGAGRTKPDIVVPTEFTSWAAPSVGSASALLLQTAREDVGLSAADDARVVKSLLLTGASRNETEFSWANSSTQPLDAVYGAGELNIYNSYQLLVSGQGLASDSTSVAEVGWDMGTAGSTTPQFYFFDLDSPDILTQMAASLTWYLAITPVDNDPSPSFSYTFEELLANLDLRLFSATGFVLGSEIAASISSVDNVELISFEGLAPGRYAWQVTSDTDDVNYGFSWRIESVQPIPEPRLALFFSSGLMVFTFLRKRKLDHD